MFLEKDVSEKKSCPISSPSVIDAGDNLTTSRQEPATKLEWTLPRETA